MRRANAGHSEQRFFNAANAGRTTHLADSKREKSTAGHMGASCDLSVFTWGFQLLEGQVREINNVLWLRVFCPHRTQVNVL
jgi:hypothetical protein